MPASEQMLAGAYVLAALSIFGGLWLAGHYAMPNLGRR